MELLRAQEIHARDIDILYISFTTAFLQGGAAEYYIQTNNRLTISYVMFP